MKTTINSKLTTIIARLIGTKAKRETLELWAESVINAHRFTSRAASVLARFDEETTRQVRLASPEELAESGHDIVAIAFALDRGVTASAMNKALKGGIDLAALVIAIKDGVDTAVFSRAVMKGLVVRFFASTVEGMNGAELTGALENFIESVDERRQFRCPVERTLARLGLADAVAA